MRCCHDKNILLFVSTCMYICVQGCGGVEGEGGGGVRGGVQPFPLFSRVDSSLKIGQIFPH